MWLYGNAAIRSSPSLKDKEICTYEHNSIKPWHRTTLVLSLICYGKYDAAYVMDFTEPFLIINNIG